MEYLLEKTGYPKKKIREKEEEEKLYIKYSIFEKHYIMCFAVFFIIVIFSVGIAWGYLNLMIKLFTIILLLLVMTVIRFFKKDYIMKRKKKFILWMIFLKQIKK